MLIVFEVVAVVVVQVIIMWANVVDISDTDYDVALLFSESERFALYLRQTLQRDFHLKVFSVDDLRPGTGKWSIVIWIYRTELPTSLQRTEKFEYVILAFEVQKLPLYSNPIICIAPLS